MFVYFNFVAKRPLRNFFTTENIPIYGSVYLVTTCIEHTGDVFPLVTMPCELCVHLYNRCISQLILRKIIAVVVLLNLLGVFGNSVFQIMQ